MHRRHRILTVALATGALLTGCASAPPPADTVTLRLWDDQVAEAYRLSLDEFTRATGIAVDVITVPWADYWIQLRADLAAGQADDLFWVNAANFEQYAEAGLLVEVEVDEDRRERWEPQVVAQYTRHGVLYGVPQLVDPGIGVIYNADLVAQAGLGPQDLEDLAWDPAAADDTLRETARLLTADVEGRHPGDEGFDPLRVSTYGYGSSNDLNATLLQFLAGNGAAWQKGDEFVFDSPAGIAAIGYAASLVRSGVSPSASETNPPGGSDHLLEEFLRGDLAMFQTGAYNLANVRDGASFEWGVASLPAGPAGRISVTNGIVLAGWSGSSASDAQEQVMDWLGSAEGAWAIGETGSALPAVEEAQQGYYDAWAQDGVDIAPMVDVLREGTIQPPQGAEYADAQAAYEPLLNAVFLGDRDTASALAEAADAANRAMNRE
ncbi:extracellular solute-binding protein [Microbacterium sp. NPDC055683]